MIKSKTICCQLPPLPTPKDTILFKCDIYIRDPNNMHDLQYTCMGDLMELYMVSCDKGRSL